MLAILQDNYEEEEEEENEDDLSTDKDSIIFHDNNL